MSSAGQRLSLATILVFCLSNLAPAMLGVVLFVYLPPYLASHLGVSLAVIGGVWASVRLIDLGIDPLLGHLMDRTDTRYGRYRVWLAAGVPVFALGTYMLFMAPQGIGGGYLFFWLFFLYVGNSIINLSQTAWSATLATGYDERSRIFGILTAVGVIAAVVSLLVPVFAPMLGITAPGADVRAMGWMIIACTPLGIWLATWFTPERVNRATVHQFVARDYLEIVTKPEVVRLYLAQVMLTLGPGWMSAMYLFYFQDVRGFTSQQSTILLLIYILIGVAGAPLTARLATRIGKHRTLMVTTTAFSLGLLTIPFYPKGNLLLMAPGMAWAGFMAAGFGLMVNAMMADVGDEIRLHQGKERISLLYALLSFAGKLTAGFAIGLTFPLLAFFGYNAGEHAHNTPQAVKALEWIFIAGPIVFVMLGGVCVWGWKLDAAKHAAIRAELDARDAAALAQAAILADLGAAPSAALVVEDAT
ncbi:MAG: MFS transporter [Alphaproteobacteria bacterium]|nr:MFS transporter [Alphaproteobacteria bacterium]